MYASGGSKHKPFHVAGPGIAAFVATASIVVYVVFSILMKQQIASVDDLYYLGESCVWRKRAGLILASNRAGVKPT